MLELPESSNLALQLNKTIKGKIVWNVRARCSPHRFAFFFGDPDHYQDLLSGKRMGEAYAVAGFVEIEAEDLRMIFNDGVNIRYYAPGEPIPPKHQLHIEFTDGASLVFTVQMYGGLCVCHAGEMENPYYLVAKQKPSPLTAAFDEDYFKNLLDHSKPGIGAKAFLATEQRIPGLGNGVLQDILFRAKVNPRSPVDRLTFEERTHLFMSVKQTLSKMTMEGGRDIEKDLFGHNGGYLTVMSNKNEGHPCPLCGSTIVKQAYLGGAVYFCPACQPVRSKGK